MATTSALNQPTNGAPSSGSTATSGTKPLLEVKNLRKFFPIRKGILRSVVGHVRAVDDDHEVLAARQLHAALNRRHRRDRIGLERMQLKLLAVRAHHRFIERFGRVVIEDDYLIKKDGCEHLSALAPRHPDEIEEVMKQPSPLDDFVLPGLGE